MTSQRASLIAAIREAPDDDALRLACADWFEEQGDPANVARAEFIRIQIQRANLPPEDVCQSELQARELRLLKRYAPVWCGSQHFVFKKVRFRRGFIDQVHLHLRRFLYHRRQMLDLEPVRDVRLTGWFRAPTDLVRRVAGCEEWKYIETLRIHHQGPHKHPRSNLLLLLESPHFKRLRALHLPSPVAFDTDARRRFERLEVLRRVQELRIPSLERWPRPPQEWFSEGSAAPAAGWEELKSLTLPSGLTLDLLRQLSETAFWNRLTALSLFLPPRQANESLAFIRERLPESLQDLPRGWSDSATIARLAQTPLRRLVLHSPPVAADLGRLLDATARCKLQELGLSRITEDHAAVLADSPAAANLRDLTISTQDSSPVARRLFSSEQLRSLVNLSFKSTAIEADAVRALAAVRGWDRLRTLILFSVRVDEAGIRELLASPVIQRVTCLQIGFGHARGSKPFELTPQIATDITRLPHLASLKISVLHCPQPSMEILEQGESLAWVEIHNRDEQDVQAYREVRSPEREPPVDDLPDWTS
jgi:uncharacterized protein (TIGR02996 family)